MRELNIKLENCHGIQKMNETISFDNINSSIIYAPNGTMKSSFAKTFEDISQGRQVSEEVFGLESKWEIKDENGMAISPDSIMVINPFSDVKDNSQGMLMANDKLRKDYIAIHKNIDGKKEELFSEIKKKLGYSTRSSFMVENTLLDDWGYSKNDIFLCLEKISMVLHTKEMDCALKNEELDYDKLFNDKVQTLLVTRETAGLIKQYEEKYNELVANSLYMQKGIIDHNNYENISKSLGLNGFFIANNEIRLNAKDGSRFEILKSQKELDELIKKEKEQILNTKELKDIFEKINGAITKNKELKEFNSFIQNHHDIIAEYNDIENFKRKVWIKAFLQTELKLLELVAEFKKAQDKLRKLRDEARKEVTEWHNALALFKERFEVPFTIEATNKEDVILNQDMPAFKHIFKDSRGEEEIAKDVLINVLSTGEKRAYYIMNFIFQILVAKREGKRKLLILDDISESFDYKNKHAIIEYIADISEYVDNNGERLFNIIMLTHNFDFYRTVASRIVKRGNAFITYIDEGNVRLKGGEYTRNLFGYFKDKIVSGGDDKLIVSTIPFVRNLIEYTRGDEDTDYIKLTSLLHFKNDTCGISLGDIQEIYNRHWCVNIHTRFAEGRESKSVYELLFEEADKVDNKEGWEIQNKLILSMAIRMLSDQYMVYQIRTRVTNGNEIIEQIYTEKNQNARLINIYRQEIGDNMQGILEQVALLATENIHLNSFMYEPIIDMSVVHLHRLYHKIKAIMPPERRI